MRPRGRTHKRPMRASRTSGVSRTNKRTGGHESLGSFVRITAGSDLLSHAVSHAVALFRDSTAREVRGRRSRTVVQNKRTRGHESLGSFCFVLLPAATYSPTQFPMQYHRRYQA